MNIKWVKDCEIEVAETEGGDTTIETRKVGDSDEVDIVGYGTTTIPDDKRFPQLQFGDGSVTLAVSADWFQTEGEQA